MSNDDEKCVKKCKMDVDKIIMHCYSICKECAELNGAKWPSEEYICTFWDGKCDVCNKMKGCCAVSDWKWPRTEWEWVD